MMEEKIKEIMELVEMLDYASYSAGMYSATDSSKELEWIKFSDKHRADIESKLREILQSKEE